MMSHREIALANLSLVENQSVMKATPFSSVPALVIVIVATGPFVARRVHD
jgi:hypothetical protein